MTNPSDGAVTIRPISGVTVQGEFWMYEPLNIQIPAAPLSVTSASSSADLVATDNALSEGLASSTVPRRRGRNSLGVKASGGVRRVQSRALAPGLVRPLLQLAGQWSCVNGPALAGLAAVAVALSLFGYPVAGHGLLILLVGLLSVLVHESGHFIALRVLDGGSSPAIFICEGLHAGLIRRSMSAGKDIAVTVAGPAAPGLLTVTLLGFAHFAVAEYAAAAMISVGHALTLILPGADRAALVAVARREEGPQMPPARWTD